MIIFFTSRLIIGHQDRLTEVLYSMISGHILFSKMHNQTHVILLQQMSNRDCNKFLKSWILAMSLLLYVKCSSLRRPIDHTVQDTESDMKTNTSSGSPRTCEPKVNHDFGLAPSTFYISHPLYPRWQCSQAMGFWSFWKHNRETSRRAASACGGHSVAEGVKVSDGVRDFYVS